MLDKRAEGIKADIAEARRLRDEAQEIYANYERRQREVQGQADAIVANARREADAIQKQADDELAAQAQAVATQVKGGIAPLSTELADRILGLSTADGTGRG